MIESNKLMQKQLSEQINKDTKQLDKLRLEIANALAGVSIYTSEDLAVAIQTVKAMIEQSAEQLIFLTPSYVRMLGGQTGPFLKKLVVGSEPAKNVYLEKVDIYNMYAMSESGFVVGVFKIDKPYSTFSLHPNSCGSEQSR